MTLITTEALIVKTIPFQETSLIVKLFTREQGKISVIAKGARRLKSNLRGYLEPLSHVEVIYYYKNTRDIQTLSKIDLVRAYLSDSPDIDSNVYGLAVLETIDRIIHDHQHDDEIFDLSINILKQMDRQPEIGQTLFVRFLQNIADIMGYRLNTSQCYRCKRPISSAIYNPGSGQLCCHDCIQHGTRADELSEKDLSFLGAGLDNNESNYPLPDNPARLIKILTGYLSHHLDYPLNLKSLQLLSELIN